MPEEFDNGQFRPLILKSCIIINENENVIFNICEMICSGIFSFKIQPNTDILSTCNRAITSGLKQIYIN